jgi:hypothetical protein
MLALIVLTVTSQAQTNPDPPDPDEVVSVNTRLVAVTVQMKGGDRKDGDEQEALRRLRISADGIPHAPSFVSGDGGTSVALVVDMSTSMRGRKAERTRNAIKEFMAEADARNRYTLVIFNTTIKVLGEFSGDEPGRDALFAALKAQPAAGETVLYDACLAARDILAKSSGARSKRAVVVFTDGLDTRSKVPITALNRGLDSLGGLVYFVVLGYGVARYEAAVPELNPLLDDMAAELARETQGEAFPARSTVKLFEATAKVARRLNNAVQLGFYPQAGAADSGAHVLRVQDERGKLLRSRARYVIE